jgi:hypothetical protein
MQIMPRIDALLIEWEHRHRRHPMRLYGTLARGAVWTCLNRVSWAMPDLARILRWGIRQRLIEPTEARRMWRLIQLLTEAAGVANPPGVANHPGAAPDPTPRREPPIRTQLHVLHGLARPWQEWPTEKITRNQEETT